MNTQASGVMEADLTAKETFDTAAAEDIITRVKNAGSFARSIAAAGENKAMIHAIMPGTKIKGTRGRMSMFANSPSRGML